MRLLLVEPPPPIDVYRQTVVAAPTCPPLTLATLAGAAREDGHDVQVLDLRQQANPESAFTAALRRGQPEIIGLTAYTFTFNPARRLAELAKTVRPEAKVVLGGIHAQFADDVTLIASVFDAVVLGEGERTLRELLSGAAWDKIRGLAWRDNGGFTRNPARPLIDDLDTLGFPAYDLFDLTQYNGRQWLWRSERIAMAESSRGCPFGCSFCSSGLVFGRRWRAKSARRVVDEINACLDLGFEEIHFQDDGFTTDLERAKRICELILTGGRRFPWELYNGIRVDRADDEFLALAARAGCYRMRFGVESGDQGILDGIGKGFTIDQVRRVYASARRYGIETIALFMIGLPGETEATMEATTRLATELPTDFARVSITIPTPGSALYARWNAEGRIVADNWDEYHFHQDDHLLFRHPVLNEAQIQRAYRRFYRRFYLRPRYLWERLHLGVVRGTLWRDAGYFLEKFVWESLCALVRRLRGQGRAPL